MPDDENLEQEELNAEPANDALSQPFRELEDPEDVEVEDESASTDKSTPDAVETLRSELEELKTAQQRINDDNVELRTENRILLEQLRNRVNEPEELEEDPVFELNEAEIEKDLRSNPVKAVVNAVKKTNEFWEKKLTRIQKENDRALQTSHSLAEARNRDRSQAMALYGEEYNSEKDDTFKRVANKIYADMEESAGGYKPGMMVNALAAAHSHLIKAGKLADPRKVTKIKERPRKTEASNLLDLNDNKESGIDDGLSAGLNGNDLARIDKLSRKLAEGTGLKPEQLRKAALKNYQSERKKNPAFGGGSY